MRTEPFTLDTSGSVADLPGPGETPRSVAIRDGRTVWSDLPPLQQGCIEALFDGLAVAPQSRADGGYDWALTDMNEAQWWCDDKPADAPPFRAPAFTDLAPETLHRIITDCETIARLQVNRDGVAYSDSHNAGRMIWRDRQDGKLSRFGVAPVEVEMGGDGKARFTTPSPARLARDFSAVMAPLTVGEATTPNKAPKDGARVSLWLGPCFIGDVMLFPQGLVRFVYRSQLGTYPLGRPIVDWMTRDFADAAALRSELRL